MNYKIFLIPYKNIKLIYISAEGKGEKNERKDPYPKRRKQ